MNKNTIKLTESQFKESIKKALNEARKRYSLKQYHRK